MKIALRICMVLLTTSYYPLAPANGQSIVTIPVDEPSTQKAVQVFTRLYLTGLKGPTVVYMHGCGGIGGAYEDWAKKLNSWGFNVVMPDSLTSRGVKTTCAKRGYGEVKEFHRIEDLLAAAGWIARQPWHAGKTGAIGFSMGAIAVLDAASKGGSAGFGGYENKHLAAVVAYYPYCEAVHAPNLTIPVQIHVGEKDDWTPARTCRPMQAAGKADVNFYPNAHHGFDVVGRDTVNQLGFTLKYDEQASRIAEEKTRAFLKKYLID